MGQEKLGSAHSDPIKRRINVLEVFYYYYYYSTLEFFVFYFILFYFWLCWVFVAARRLSLVVASGGYSSLRCMGFSLQWLLLLRSTGSRHVSSVVVARELSSCSSRALGRRLSSCGAWA